MSTRQKPPSASDGTLLAGAGAGFIATALLHPLDLIKTRLQVQDAASAASSRRLPVYRGLLDAARSIVSLEGWLGLYQGMGPNIFGNMTSWGLYMHFYARCKDLLAPHAEGSALYLGAATAAGTVVTLLVHPIFTVKTRLQLQLRDAAAEASVAAAGGASGQALPGQALPGKLVPVAMRNNYRGSFDAVARMVREEGVLSLYRGIGPSLLLVSHSSIQFVSYENLKLLLVRRQGSRQHDGGGGSGGGSGTGGGGSGGGTNQLGSHELLAAGTCSKVIATLGTYPYQVVRSCMQQSPVVGYDRVQVEGTAATVARIWRGEGARGFYRGILPHILRSTPQSSITLLAYEYIMRLSRTVSASK